MAELTKEASQRVFEYLGTSISAREKHVDECARMLIALGSQLETVELVALKGVLKTLLMLDYITLDLCAAYRQYLSTELTANYDKRQAMTKANCIISEGYKKIYGFNKAGREKSFWNTQIKTVVDFVGGMDAEYGSIGAELEKYSSGADSSVFDQDMRDLSVHYDGDPMKVFNMLASLNAEEVTTRCNIFLKLLHQVTRFVGKLSDLMKIKLGSGTF